MEPVDNKAAESEDSTLKLVNTDTMVEALLGSIRVGEKVFDGLGNNTRWVFDVDMQSGQKVAIDLLDFHGGQPIKPNVMSVSISPMSKSACDAKLHFSQDKGSLTVESESVSKFVSEDDAESRIIFRVSVDVVCR